MSKIAHRMSNLFLHVTKLTSQMSDPDYFVLTIKKLRDALQERKIAIRKK